MSGIIDHDIERLRHVADALIEHFDSVQIFATRHEAGRLDGTIRCVFGSGNWFARYGQVRDWIVREEESARSEVRGD